MKQPTAERYLANFFYQYFCEFFENSCSASKKKKTFRKFFLPSWQKTPMEKSYFSKVQAFTEAATGGVL